MSIFRYLDYRIFLSDEFSRRKKDQPGFTQDRLARAAGMQPTYLTNVLKGRSNFNSDQIYALAQELKLSEVESKYLFLLKEHDQSSAVGRKARLRDEIEELRKTARKTETHITAKVQHDPAAVMRYYGDPYIKIVHLIAQIPRYSGDYEPIARELNINSDYLLRILATLSDLKMITFKNKSIEVLQKNFHLPKDSPMLLPHQVMMRTKSAQRLTEVPADERYSFSVTFSATEETRQYVQAQFLEFVSRIEREVKSAESENAYQLNFDLFPWNRISR